MPTMFPVAVAWISCYPHHTILYFILVPDHLRRQGYATALIKACRERWPELYLTDAISESGFPILMLLDDMKTSIKSAGTGKPSS